MVWCLIHKFSIQEISEEELSARDGLLLWCQKVTKDYSNVKIENFYSSWENGLAFAAIIHKHRPDLIDYSSMSAATAKDNLKTSFDVASEKLGLPRLLEVEDFENLSKSDEKSIMTYVACMWKAFASSQKTQVAAGRLSKFAGRQAENDRIAKEYEEIAEKLTQWIEETTKKHDTTEFGNNLELVQGKFDEFQAYKNGEKVEKTSEKIQLEIRLNNLHTKQRAEGAPLYSAKTSSERVNELWNRLNQVDTAYDNNVREALRRQKYLDILLQRYRSKVRQLTAWVEQKTPFLKEDSKTDSVAAAQSKLKSTDAFLNEYNATAQTFDSTVAMGAEIIASGHSASDECAKSNEFLETEKRNLGELAKAKKEALEKEHLYQVFLENLRELGSWISEKQAFLTSDLNAETVQAAQSQLKVLDSYNYEYDSTSSSNDRTVEVGTKVIELDHPEKESVAQALEKLAADRNNLEELSKTRRSNLQKELEYRRFQVLHAELAPWIEEQAKFLVRLLFF